MSDGNFLASAVNGRLGWMDIFGSHAQNGVRNECEDI
jgi:hypothetical protein